MPPASLCLKRRRVKSRGWRGTPRVGGTPTEMSLASGVACPAAWVVKHASVGRPTQMPEDLGGGLGLCAACQRAGGGGGMPLLAATAGQQTLWRPLGRLRDRCWPGGIAAWRLHPRQSLPMWGSVALGRGRGDMNPCLVGPQIRSSGPRRRGGDVAREEVPAGPCVLGLPERRLGSWCHGRSDVNAARTRLSTPGSSCRITLPIYCGCRVRAPCERMRCAASTASCRVSGRSSRASWAADRATSSMPSVYNACASRLR